MKRVFGTLLLTGLLALGVQAAESPRSFLQSLSAAERSAMGLADLTPEQRAALDAAVAAYGRGEKSVAVAQAVQQAEQQAEIKVRQAEQKAAEAAVADYRKKSEPGLIARTVEKFKRTAEEEKRERFTARIVGEFRGWQGGTYFPLENGQVWRQVGTEDYELPPVQNAEVEIVRSANGYWRLKYAGGWITVKRLQ